MANQAYSVDTNGQNVTFASALTSSGGSLTKLGAGTLTLTGANTYTGGTTLAGGTLSLGSAGALGSTGALSFSGGTLQYSSANQTDYSARFSTAANQAYNIDTNGQNVTFASALTSSGGSLTKLGAGTLTLNNNNFYTGGTTLAAGILNVGSIYALDNGSVLSFTGGTLQLGVASFDAFSARFSTAANQAYNIDTNGFNTTFSTGLTSSGATLTKLGAGTLTLKGASTYTGATTVNGGTLMINGSLANTSITVNSGGTLFVGNKLTNTPLTVNAGGTLSIFGSNVSGNTLVIDGTGESFAAAISAGLVSVGTTGVFRQSAGGLSVGTDLNISGSYLLFDGNNLGYAGLSVPGTEAVGYNGSSGVFSQSAGLNTAGTVNLGSAGTYYLGGGTLTAGSIGASQGTSTFNFDGGTLRPSASQSSLLQGVNTVAVRNGGAIIDTNGFNLTVPVALQHSTLSGDNATDGGLTVLGGGTLTLTGANTYTGPTNVQQTSLIVSGSGSLRSSALTDNGYVRFEGNGVSGIGNATINGTLFVTDSAWVTASFLTLNSSSYLQGDGRVSAFTLTIAGAIGSFEQRGGTVELRSSLVANGYGYNLYGGTLYTQDSSSVGSYGNGSFTQYGGQSRSSAIVIGDHGTGSVRLSGGSMTAGDIYIGSSGTGFFTQYGGTLQVGDGITLGFDAGGNGTYNLSGGVLTTDHVVGGPGTSTFNFDGGTLRRAVSPYGSQDNFLQGLTTANVRNGGAIIDTNGFNATVPQVLQHSNIGGDSGTDGGLTKLGAGTLALSGANTYNGATTVSAGTLLAQNTSGSATGTGAVTVQSGGALGGNGTISGAVTVQDGGALAPGALAVSRLTLGSTLTLQTNSLLAITLGGTTAGSTYDQVVVNGTLTLAGTLKVSTVNGFALAVGQTFTILNNTSDTALTLGVFSNALGTLYTDAAGDTFLVNYAANTDNGLVANDVTLTYLGINVVPEPSTWAFLALGTLGLYLTLRGRRALG